MSSIVSILNINPSLWLLLKMNSRGALRKFLRNLLTIHGVILAAFLGAYFYLSVTHRNEMISDSYKVLAHQGGLALFVLFLVLAGSGFAGHGVYFTHPEIQFFQSAPLKRQELLTYKFLKHIQGAAVFSLFFAILFSPDNFLHVLFRLLPVILVVHTFPIAITALSQRLPPALPKLLHRSVNALLASLLALATWGGVLATSGHRREGVLAFLESRELHTGLFPFYRANALLFQSGAEQTLIWATLTTGFAVLCFSIGLRYFDLQNDQSNELRDKTTEKVERFKKHGLTLPRVQALELKIPDLPRMDGVGPTLWRRCQELSRYIPYWFALLVLGLGYHAWIASILLQKAASTGKGVSGLADLFYIGHITASIVAFSVATFDFKADTHRLEWLKSLPLKPSRIVIGQLTLSSLYLSAFISLQFLMNYGLLSHYFPQKYIGSAFFGYLLLSAPLGILYVAIANALFILIPTYGAEQRTSIGIFQYLTGGALLLGMMVLLHAVNNGCATISKHIGHTDLIFFALTTISFSLLASLALGLVVWAYNRFDISRVSR